MYWWRCGANATGSTTYRVPDVQLGNNVSSIDDKVAKLQAKKLGFQNLPPVGLVPTAMASGVVSVSFELVVWRGVWH